MNVNKYKLWLFHSESTIYSSFHNRNLSPVTLLERP